ncbi:MAG: ABC transporter ATP-binding protein, partial [Clostridia bacterium]|nr:ABC transporter ATP-binding protein [Clostridia bacterium]
MMRGPGGGKNAMKNAGMPGAKNPGKTMKRILSEVMSRYKFHYLLVLVCIVVSAVCSVRGTLFTQTLIDDYIIPMTGQENPDFGPLFRA